MGNESSTPVDEATPPTAIHARTIEAVAEYIKEKDIKKIVVMVRDPIPIGVCNMVSLTAEDRRRDQYFCWDS